MRSQLVLADGQAFVRLRQIIAANRDLFAIDAATRRRALATAVRHIRRPETAGALVDDIRSKIEAAQSAALPSCALSKARQYMLTLGKS
jgi:hypothetical protein